MIPLHIVHTKQLPIFEQLQIEEAILRAGDGNWCFINEGTSAAIVMGISAKPNEVINSEVFQQNPIPVIRRFSGGGTVIVEKETLFVTFIFEKQAIQIETCPIKLLQWSFARYASAFTGIDFRLIENDYAIGDKKIGGNAQYFTKDRLLQHTSFLWDYCPEMMKLLCIPPKVPEYRKNRPHEMFITSLKPYFSSKKSFVSKFKNGLASTFCITDTSIDHARSYQMRPHRKSLHFLPKDAL